MEEVDFFLKHSVETMEKSLARLSKELSKIRAGKAMPNMLDALNVDYYGNSTPINQVASITTPDARTLIIKPWEKSIIGEIEKAIDDAMIRDPELIIVEGQGSLTNQYYAGVTLGLLHGAMPDYMLMTHDPARPLDVTDYPCLLYTSDAADE